MALSTDVLKGLGKIQHLFIIKALKKVGVKGIFPNIIRTIYDKAIADIILNEEKLKPFLLKSRLRQGFSLSPLLFNVVLESLTRTIRQQQEIKGIQIGKVEFKLSLLADDMILSLKILKILTKLLEILNYFDKVAGCKINIQKSVAFLYTVNEHTEKKNQVKHPIYKSLKTNKLPRINLTKEIKNDYSST
jgi:hypothetical protein